VYPPSITTACVTLYLHRCQTHRALDLHPAVSHFLRLLLWLSFGGTFPPNPQGYRIQAAFPSAGQLGTQADVRIAGVTIGKLKLWRDTSYTRMVSAGPNTNAEDVDPRIDLANSSTWKGLRNLPPLTLYVQPGHYLCLGDNSPHSSDGRAWGLVPDRLLLGRALGAGALAAAAFARPAVTTADTPRVLPTVLTTSGGLPVRLFSSQVTSAAPSLPAAQNTLLHRSQGYLYTVCNFFVSQALNITKNHCRTKYRAYFFKSPLNQQVCFPVKREIKRRRAPIARHIECTAIVVLAIDGHFPFPVPRKPAPVIVRFVYGDSIDPGPQAAPFFKRIHAAEDLQKDLLNYVGCIVLIAEQSVDHAVHWLLITVQQFFIG